MKKEIKLIPMKARDIKPLKEKIWLQNGKKCPVLDKEIPLDKMVLDHKHKLKSEEPDEVKGAIREALEFRVNSLLGRVENGIKRYGLDKDPDFDLPTFLRNAADYFEKGSYLEEDDNSLTYYIHPNEVPKREKVKVRDWNRIEKYYLDLHPRKKKIPKKPIYINEEFLRLKEITEKHIQKLKEEKELRRKEKEINKNI